MTDTPPTIDTGVFTCTGTDEVQTAHLLAHPPADREVTTAGTLDSAVPPEVADLIRDLRATALADDTVETGDTYADTVDEWYETTVVPTADETVRVYLQNITEQVEAKALAERQTTRLEKVASTVSHDFGNPLSICEGFLDMARQTGDDAHFDRVETAHDRIFEMVDRVVAVIRKGQPVTETTAVAIDERAEAVWNDLDHPAVRDATLTVADPPTVTAEADRVDDILTEVFVNALEHSDDSVTVRVSGTDTGFSVEDTGPGFPDGKEDAVFDYGYTTENDQSGLGLSLVQEIAHAHGWTVTAETTADGARISVHTDADAPVHASEESIA